MMRIHKQSGAGAMPTHDFQQAAVVDLPQPQSSARRWQAGSQNSQPAETLYYLEWDLRLAVDLGRVDMVPAIRLQLRCNPCHPCIRQQRIVRQHLEPLLAPE